MKKFLSLSLAFLILSSVFLVSCKDATETNNNNANKDSAEPSSFETTSTVLVENFRSDYKIVIPEKETKYEEYAAQELQYFLCESTGCTLPIISDSGLTANASNKYLSVGNTTLLTAQTSIKLDDSVMGDTTPSIDTVGNSVYMVGTTDFGTLNSVYKFLEYQIGYKAYAYDCIEYDYHSKLYLLDFDYHYVPNVEYFTTNEYEIGSKDRTAAAMRMNMFSAGSSLFKGGLFSGLWCHTNGVVMSETGYPWAYNNGQLCMSDPEVLEIYCQNFTMNFAINASGPFLMIGGNDNEAVCNCSACIETIGKYGSGGLMSIFINKVADYVEKYFKEKGIDKKLCIVGLYYLGYDDIPARLNADGTYSPIDECVIPDNEGNITAGICYAPMLACYTHPFGDGACEKNEFYTQGFRKAAALTDNIFAYLYGSYFITYEHVYFFNSWSQWEEMYEFFKELGVRYVTEETNRWTIRPFSSMNIYIRSRMAWDETNKIDTLVNDFTDAYYGIASGYMKDYYDAIMEHYQSTLVRTKTYHESVYSATVKAETYPHQVYLNFAAILESALHEIEVSNLPEDKKAIYYERVQREWYIVKIQEYNMHKESLDKAYRDELEKIFLEGQEKYDIWVSRRGGA